MKRLSVLIYTLAIAVGYAAFAQLTGLQISSPNTSQLVEGRTYDIRWDSSNVQTITVTASGSLISRPGDDRGRFNIVIGQLPASRRSISWKVPYLDTVNFSITITGYDLSGQVVAKSSRDYNFRPAVLSDKRLDGIYVDLSNTNRQRLYRVKKGLVTNAYLTSGARTQIFLSKARDSAEPHNHLGVFKITEKIPLYWSRQYKVWMTHAMRFWKGHFIHGTYPSEYHRLGQPASSGCIRLDRTDAKQLYGITSIGTRVEIIGPEA